MHVRLRDVIGGGIAQKNVRAAELEYLRKTDKPVWIFGGGSGGQTVARFLLANGVSFEGFCESEYYFREGKRIMEKQVCLYDKMRCAFPRHELVLGASGQSIYAVVQEEKSAGNRVFVFDNTTPLYTMSPEWVRENVDLLDETLAMLADDLSRETFFSFIEDKAHCLSADVRPLWELWTDSQYFNRLYDPAGYRNHVMADCGAWIGDTAEEFLTFVQAAGFSGTVHAFEPDPENFRRLGETAKRRGNIECYPYAVGDRQGTVLFATGNSSRSHLGEESGVRLPMVPVDDILKEKEVSFIKMDLEGGEENALKGMHNLIVRNAPYMAICIYHRVDDLIRLPRLIKSYADESKKEYKYYLRHHSSTSYETVFYAVPQ